MSERAKRTRILVVDDEEIVRESLSGWLAKDGYTVAAAADGAAAIEQVRRGPWSILLVDLKMPPGLDGLQVLEEVKKLQPEVVVVIMTAYATVDTAVTAMKLGAQDYLVKPFDPQELSLLIHRIVEQQGLARENVLLRRAVRKEYRFRDLLTRSPAMLAVFDLARAAARSPSTILILGESGTGKELLARAIHVESPRRGPFVPVSCAALTETLLESELFGHEKGAFTGAALRRVGKFEAADRGTLFLDEIGDVSPKLQMDLLRVLEERRFFRVGGTAPIEVDVRIIAATNRDLGKAVRDGAFREDLFYRLNVVAITLPPLRARRDDVPLLVEDLLERLNAEMGRRVEGVSAEAMGLLQGHGWPGNVRELRNVLERAMVVASGTVLRARDLGLALPSAGEPAAPGAELLSLDDVVGRHVAAVLLHTGGNISEAARLLGIDRVTLYHKIKKYGIPRHEDQRVGSTH